MLEACRVIAAPQTHSGETLALDIASRAVDLTGKKILPLYFSMARDRQQQRQAHLEAAQAVREELDRGEDVAMLNLGDVSIYATYSYLMEILRGGRVRDGDDSRCAQFLRCGGPSGCEPDGDEQPAAHRSRRGRSPGGNPEAAGDQGTDEIRPEVPQVLEALEAHGLTEKSALVRDCGLPTEEVCEDLRHPRRGPAILPPSL